MPGDWFTLVVGGSRLSRVDKSLPCFGVGPLAPAVRCPVACAMPTSFQLVLKNSETEVNGDAALSNILSCVIIRMPSSVGFIGCRFSAKIDDDWVSESAILHVRSARIR